MIESQLAHAVKDANGRAYNRTQYLKQRTLMMQRWADYLDALQSQAHAVGHNQTQPSQDAEQNESVSFASGGGSLSPAAHFVHPEKKQEGESMAELFAQGVADMARGGSKAQKA